METEWTVETKKEINIKTYPINKSPEWILKCKKLEQPCEFSKERIKNGRPRILDHNDKLRSLPKFIGMDKYKYKLVDMFTEEFSQHEEPAGIIVYSLCGYTNCVNPDHLPVIFRSHKKGVDAMRIESNGVNSWWKGAEDFYLTYKDFVFEDEKRRNEKETKRAYQRKIQAKLSRRKKRYSENQIARALNMVFGNEASMEMYKELRNMFEHITRDMFDHVLMTYAPRAAEIRKGNVTPGYVPDGRKIPFKKRKEK